MNFPDLVALAGGPPELRFLVIGGYAVAAHGHTRPTFDIDFLVRKADREEWNARLGESYSLLAESPVFAQFAAQEGPPLDLMLVDDRTFEKLWSTAEERAFGTAVARVPALENLIALKLHALKQALPHRTFKDAEDVEMLIRRNGLDIETPAYQELFLKYGTREIYKTLVRLLRNP